MTDDLDGKRAVRELVKEKSVTMEYFLEVSHLDAATAEMLKKYDRDGNGSFSKDEVVAIILDLREAMQSNEMLGESNKLFKRLLAAALCFCILLLTAMFGLSYAVTVLTAKTDVSSSGVMTATNGGAVVATDSTATTVATAYVEETGTNCMPSEEAERIFESVSSGRNVLVQGTGANGTGTFYEHVTASGLETSFDGGDRKTCFNTADGRRICIGPTPNCQPLARRHLQALEACKSTSTTWTGCQSAASPQRCYFQAIIPMADTDAKLDCIQPSLTSSCTPPWITPKVCSLSPSQALCDCLAIGGSYAGVETSKKN